ncbi:uncharacterized protein LTR77_003230 [Saxophila tyrrhenica]|uniref:Heterokaryon incompatibility domain-containing protein n=1 Tax=Saxophila tyrrhenica TaxID=1690608 RepID=A0AAV9PLG7_9PEZI|nr:hypothetical protein LTR77_003230 [Saxophila tyrrhenica]
MADRYVYEPLRHEDSIRLVEVAGNADTAAPLSCRLVEARLSDEPRYSAISYTWEDQTPDQEIHVDGRVLLITKNCEAALRRFRPALEHEKAVLWIDQVCVSQSDAAVEERNHQVGIMGKTYAAAEIVLTWLHHSRLRIERYEECLYAATWLAGYAELAHIQDCEERDRKLIAWIEENNPLFLDEALDEFYWQTPWFNRLWCVQEVALSQRAVFVWEDVMIDPWALSEANDRTRQILKRLNKSETTAYRVTWTVIGLTKVYLEARGNLSWTPSLLVKLASKPEDNAFALHGLLTAAGVPLPAPDYSMPLAEIYWHYTVQIMKSGGLGLLEGLTGLEQLSSAPSWVANWNYAANYVKFKPAPQREFRYHYDVQFAENDRHLLVRGVSNDMVSQRARFRSLDLVDPARELTSLLDVPSLEDFWREAIETSIECSEALVLMWNLKALKSFVGLAQTTNKLTDPRKEEDAGSGREMFELLRTSRAIASETIDFPAFTRLISHIRGRSLIAPDHEVPLTGSTLDDQILALSTNPKHAAWQERIELQILRTVRAHPTSWAAFLVITLSFRYQTMFRTESGKLGLAPHSIAAGDSVFMCQGSWAPAIIRREGEHYRWVTSRAYIMDRMEYDIYPEDDDKLQYYTFV